MNEQARPKRVWPLRVLAVFFGLVGSVMSLGGAELIWLGGSAYYFAGGLTLIVSGVLLWRRDRRGSWLVGLYLGSTLVWSIVEVGFDGWGLAPRLIGPSVIAATLLLPVIRNALIQPPLRGVGKLTLGIALTLIAVVSVQGMSPGQSGADSAEAKLPPNLVAQGATASGEWPSWGGTEAGQRFSPLAQITPSNVNQLEIAWEAHLGVPPAGTTVTVEVTPVMVGNTLFACNGLNVVTAMEATTGKTVWIRNLRSSSEGLLVGTCRGVTFYRAPAIASDAACASRIITATSDARLVALDAANGSLCQDFGQNGIVDLKRGMGPVIAGYYHVSSAPTLVRNRVVIGGWITDNQFVGEPSGVVRAFDAVTGRFAWAWDMGRPGKTNEPTGTEHYSRGTPNSWAPASADEVLGLVFIPTGNATPDFWGGHRTPEMNRFASSVVALDAENGAVRWAFQTTHHDLWDYDVASQPTLVDWPIAKHQTIPALVQPTKRGQIFVLDRRNGRPLVPVIERPAPGNGAPGEQLATTQPYSAMPSMAGDPLREVDMWGLTPLDQLWCRLRFRKARYEGEFTPPGLKPTIQYPGYVGGFNWGGIAIDPVRQLLFVNVNHFANYGRLLTREEAKSKGLKIFTGGGAKASEEALTKPMMGTPYAAEFNPFMSPLGVPCQKPPFGEVAAIDMRDHRIIWRQPLGTARDSGPLGIPIGLPLRLGTPALGGATLTRSGLAFIGATQERDFRAIETSTGKVLWRTRLPAGGNANPMTYMGSDGRQYVVIAAGGAVMLGGPTDDRLIAFALPQRAIRPVSGRK